MIRFWLYEMLYFLRIKKPPHWSEIKVQTYCMATIVTKEAREDDLYKVEDL